MTRTKRLKLFVIHTLDAFDALVLRHNLRNVCANLMKSSWWGDHAEASGPCSCHSCRLFDEWDA